MSEIQYQMKRLQEEIEEEIQKYNQIDKKGQQLVNARNSLH